MARVKMGRWEYTERELERMFDEATICGRLASASEPQAKSVHYDRATKRVVVELKNGATFIFPSELAQGLRGAAGDDISQVDLGPRGASLHWEKLDVDFSLVGLMSGVFGSKAWMARLNRDGSSGKKKAKLSRTAAGEAARGNREEKEVPSRSRLAKNLRSETQRRP